MTKRKALRNIRNVMKHASYEEIHSGSNWYFSARDLCASMAEQYNLPLFKVVHAVAALSPNVRWLTNVSAADKLLSAYRKHGNSFGGVVVAGYRKNAKKAQDIILGTAQLSGQKVTAFASNILNPGESQHVTVDFHAYSVADWKRYTAKSCPSISPKVYRIISDAYATVASEYRILPHQCQAIAWTVWKRLVKEA